MKMRKFGWITLLFGFALLWNCQKNNPQKAIEGQILGFKKGTVYLHLFQGDSLMTVDSIQIKGSDRFRFNIDTVSPQLAVITVKELPDAYLLVFTDDTLIKIKTVLKKMGLENRIEGGPNYAAWKEYDQMVKQMNERRLDAIKQKFEAQKEQDTAQLKKAEKELLSIERRFKRFAYNFSATHADLPAGAYVAWENFRDNQVVLDSLYPKFSEEAKQSIYGKYIKAKIQK